MRLNGKYLIPAAIGLMLICLCVLYFVGRHDRKQQAAEAALSPLPRIHEVLKNGKSVFLSGEFIPLLAHDYSIQLPTLSEVAGCEDASAFYRLNREKRFSALFLSTRPASLKLVRDLMESPLWVLSEVLPGGYLFLPAGSPAWSLPEPGYWLKTFPNPDVRSSWLIGTAAALIPIGRSSDAEQLLSLAEAIGRKKSLIFATRASLDASRGDWRSALRLSRESLHLNHGDLVAEMIEIRALTECGHSDEALVKALRLAEKEENQETLFLLARTASAANSTQEEIDSLQRLVRLARRHGQPLGATLTYLGQAFARHGDRGEALRTFQEAIASPELTDAQRNLLRGVMDHLMQGDIPSSSLPALPSTQSPTNNSPGNRP